MVELRTAASSPFLIQRTRGICEHPSISGISTTIVFRDCWGEDIFSPDTACTKKLQQNMRLPLTRSLRVGTYLKRPFEQTIKLAELIRCKNWSNGCEHSPRARIAADERRKVATESDACTRHQMLSQVIPKSNREVSPRAHRTASNLESQFWGR